MATEAGADGPVGVPGGVPPPSIMGHQPQAGYPDKIITIKVVSKAQNKVLNVLFFFLFIYISPLTYICLRY